MHIWRIEDKDGKGPYNCSNYSDDVMLDDMLYIHNSDPVKHPTCTCDVPITIRLPENVGGNFRYTNAKRNIRYKEVLMLSGFNSFQKLEKWFDGYIDMLIDKEFSINIYQISREYVNVYKHQVLFIKDYAKLIDFIEW